MLNYYNNRFKNYKMNMPYQMLILNKNGLST